MASVTHPFVKPTADIILRSSDNVDFRVHKLILSEASPVFESMFSLPRPTESSDSEDAVVDGLAVVPFGEASRVLGHLLRICYPMPDPGLDTLGDVEPVIEAALKYDIKAALHMARKRLVDPRFLEESLYGVYAIAWRQELGPEINLIARMSLKVTLPHYFTEELSAVPPAALYHLQEYRSRCVAAASDFVWNFDEWKDIAGDRGITFGDQSGHDAYGDRLEEGSGHYRMDNCYSCPDVPYDGIEPEAYRYLPLEKRCIQEDLAATLQKTPHGSSVKNITYISEGVIDLHDHFCAPCRQNGLDKIKTFCEDLSHRIDAAIARVPFRPDPYA
ncbi:hypothetical protein B0H21DRAFT_822684 [Amylocystis lapponica]|nr:hypothetical protein B0H21DRAFT_822684 [Amylocystis lapponica]